MDEFITLTAKSTSLSLHSEPYYRVGVKEISFAKPKPLRVNLTTDQQLYIIYFDGLHILKTLDKNVIIKKGIYTIDELVRKCNEGTNAFYNNYLLKNSEQTGIKTRPMLFIKDEKINMMAGLTTDNEKYFIKFSDELGDVLGFPTTELTNYIRKCYNFYMELLAEKKTIKDTADSFTLKPPIIPEIKPDYLVLTSNICENSVVHNKSMPVLKVIDFKNEDRVTRLYENPQFYRVKQLDNVSLDLIDSFGNELSLDNFYVTLEIHRELKDSMLEPLHDDELQWVDEPLENPDTTKWTEDTM